LTAMPHSPAGRRSDSLMFLPVWNQARELPTVLAEIDRSAPPGVDFLLVNNGSTDGSEKMIANSGLPYFDIPKNLGIGYSYQRALDWARERDYRFFGTMASNGKMLASEVPRLLEPLRAGEADYVTGSRFLPGGEFPNLPLFRRLAIPAVNLFAWLTTGRRLTDATNGFRAFRLQLLQAADFPLDSEWMRTYGFEYYLYAKALRDRRVRCLEVPTTMRYPEQGRYSKIRPGRDWWAILKPWLVARFDGKGFGDLPVEVER
jgi:dolichol-phosphate mannosyltransferase